MFPTFEKIYNNILNGIIKLYQDIVNNPKAILNYCLRVVLYLILNMGFVYQLTISIVCFLFNPLTDFSEEPFIALGLIVLLFLVFQNYFCAKICGLFKKLDSLNFFIALIIIFTIDILLNCVIPFGIEFSPFEVHYYGFNYIVILPFLFLFYKFFNLLSKRYTLFAKIGYYTSAEFYRKLLNK